MATNYNQDGDVINYTAGAAITKGAIVKMTEVCGVAIAAATGSGAVIPVAVEGVWTVTKKAGATLDFAVGEMAYSLTTGGVEKAVATGATVPIGYAVEAAVTGATTVKVKLSR
jgi:predicted RecA/RadA family phage recombinase